LQRNHQSRANTKHQQRADLKQHESPTKYSTSTNDELLNEDTLPVFYQRSSTHIIEPVTLDGLYSNSKNNNNNKQIQKTLTGHRDSPFNDRTNRYTDRAQALNTSDDNLVDSELIFKINDFKRPHSAFQIDNPPDENSAYHHHNFHHNGFEANSVNLIKQGDFMNRNSSGIKKISNQSVNAVKNDQNFIVSCWISI
jgi:hypothetical protein